MLLAFRASGGRAGSFRSEVRPNADKREGYLFNALLNNFTNSRWRTIEITMNEITVDLDRLDHPSVVYHLTNSDSRIIAGARYVLKYLDIPFPDYLQLKPAGRPAAKRVMEEFRKDYPETLHQATMRKSREAAARMPVNAP